MKKVNLKLTDNEIMFLDISTDISKLNRGIAFEEEFIFLCKNSAKRIDIDISDNEFLIQDADKFRKFLLENITDLVGDFLNDQNLKSIIMKLDKEVKWRTIKQLEY